MSARHFVDRKKFMIHAERRRAPTLYDRDIQSTVAQRLNQILVVGCHSTNRGAVFRTDNEYLRRARLSKSTMLDIARRVGNS